MFANDKAAAADADVSREIAAKNAMNELRLPEPTSEGSNPLEVSAATATASVRANVTIKVNEVARDGRVTVSAASGTIVEVVVSGREMNPMTAAAQFVPKAIGRSEAMTREVVSGAASLAGAAVNVVDEAEGADADASERRVRSRM